MVIKQDISIVLQGRMGLMTTSQSSRLPNFRAVLFLRAALRNSRPYSGNHLIESSENVFGSRSTFRARVHHRGGELDQFWYVVFENLPTEIQMDSRGVSDGLSHQAYSSN